MMTQRTVQSDGFINETVELDGKLFRDCTFLNCQLQYAGGVPWSFDQCEVNDCRLVFTGPANQTLDLLRQMHSSAQPFHSQFARWALDYIQGHRANEMRS